MTFRLVLIALGVILGGCAGLHSIEPPGCGSGPRRPANPHGSVLVPSPAPVALPEAVSETMPEADPAPDLGGCT